MSATVGNSFEPQSNFEANVHQACYAFDPQDSFDLNDRPKKRRKTDKQSIDTEKASRCSSIPFVPLLGGNETTDCVNLRYKTYQKLWQIQEDRIDEILQSDNGKTLNQVASFVKGATAINYDLKLPTGLIAAGPNIASHGLLFRQLKARIKAETGGPFVTLRSGDSPNLKTVLKKLIKAATDHEKNDGDEPSENKDRRNKLLDFDLQLLYEYVEKHSCKRVVIAFQDSEAFDGEVLADLLPLLHSWLGRIPFVLLFGIATSVEMFHEKLPRSAIQCMRGEEFDVERAEETLQRVFDKAIDGSGSVLRLGGALSRFLLERQKDNIQSVQAFINSLKYAFMSHFYANPLSILLAGQEAVSLLQSEHYEAIRNLASFRELIERVLIRKESSEARKIRQLLDEENNRFLANYIKEQYKKQQEDSGRLADAIKLLQTAQSSTISRTLAQRSQIYVKVLSRNKDSAGELERELLLSIKKLPSNELQALLAAIVDLHLENAPIPREFLAAQEDLISLIEAQNAQSRPLRSAHEAQHSYMRTKVVGQKVELSHQRHTVSDRDAEYSELLSGVHGLFSSYFRKNLRNPSRAFLSEVFFYDLRAPHRAGFTPKPRNAIERALSAPHDYLGCGCCGDVELSKTQPQTAILYQLYLESGQLINVRDMWESFSAIVRDTSTGDDETQDRTHLATFYEGLAHLKHMGMVKQNRKKIDHIAKLAWKGL